jgi:hypothetical protein
MTEFISEFTYLEIFQANRNKVAMDLRLTVLTEIQPLPKFNKGEGDISREKFH